MYAGVSWREARRAGLLEHRCMSFRYFPHALLFIGTFFFLVKGTLILIDRKVRIPFTFNRHLEGRSAVITALVFFMLAVVCAWDFIYLLVTAQE